MIEYALVLAAIFLGLLVSFMSPFFKKIYAGELKLEDIDPKYLAHLIITTFWEFIASFTLYISWTPPSGIINDILILILAFSFGFGGSGVQKEIEKWINEYKKKRLQSSGSNPSG